MSLNIGQRWTGLCVALACLAAPLPARAQAEAAPKAAPPQVVQDYQPRPALWLLQDDDTKIYLLGTIHILPPGFRWRSKAIDRVVQSADELVVEATDGAGDELERSARDLFLIDTPRPILLRVPEEKRAALSKAIESGPLPVEAYSNIRTWAAALMIGLADLLGDYGVADVDDAPGVEEHLEADFRAAGKPISQIEDPVTVLASLNSIPEEAQRELLLSGLEDLEGDTAIADEDHAWAKGEVRALAEDLEEAMPPALFDVLVRRRNAAWAEWAEKRLEKPGVVLVAVGAAHLAGEASLQKMLKTRGLPVKRFD